MWNKNVVKCVNTGEVFTYKGTKYKALAPTTAPYGQGSYKRSCINLSTNKVELLDSGGFCETDYAKRNDGIQVFEVLQPVVRAVQFSGNNLDALNELTHNQVHTSGVHTYFVPEDGSEPKLIFPGNFVVDTGSEFRLMSNHDFYRTYCLVEETDE